MLACAHTHQLHWCTGNNVKQQASKQETGDDETRSVVSPGRRSFAEFVADLPLPLPPFWSWLFLLATFCNTTFCNTTNGSTQKPAYDCQLSVQQTKTRITLSACRSELWRPSLVHSRPPSRTQSSALTIPSPTADASNCHFIIIYLGMEYSWSEYDAQSLDISRCKFGCTTLRYILWTPVWQKYLILKVPHGMCDLL